MTHLPVENGSAGGEASVSSAEVLIGAARGGCSRSLGVLAQRYRRYLLLVANESLSPALRAKTGASDLVQETLLHFQKKFGRFEGKSEEELLTWLRRILYFRALQVARQFGGTAARDIRREVSISELNGSVHSVTILDGAPTPCTSLAAKEQLANLTAAIAVLPDESQQVIRLRNIERKSFRDIGETLGCSAESARKRWVRAVGQLRIHMNAHE